MNVSVSCSKRVERPSKKNKVSLFSSRGVVPGGRRYGGVGSYKGKKI